MEEVKENKKVLYPFRNN